MSGSVGEFDRLLNGLDTLRSDEAVVCGEDVKSTLIVVADTLYLCTAWWRQHGRGIVPSAGDLLRMTEMVLAEEASRKRQAETRLQALWDAENELMDR
jgi:hypothetical protein